MSIETQRRVCHQGWRDVEVRELDLQERSSRNRSSSTARIDQPILSGHEAVINANERQAIAAAQLPDPKLSGGLKELPVDTREAFSLRRDNFTEFTVGLSQEFPRADKRRAQGRAQAARCRDRTRGAQ